MSISSRRTLIGMGTIALLFSFSLSADAQIVRRYARGGVAVRAPFVRVDVGPGGATSVRAPFVAIDDPGGVYIGRRGRRRLYAQQQPAAGYGAPYQEPTLAAQPTYVDAYPLPTTEQLAAMNDLELINTVWDLSARLDARFARFDTGDSWQRYLGFPANAFSKPGVQPVEIRLDALVKTLARFDSVSDNPEFAKIAGLPIFIATKAALRQAVERFQSGSVREGGPQMVDPSDPFPAPSDSEPADPNEVLPTPEPTTRAAATRGERSILKKSTRR